MYRLRTRLFLSTSRHKLVTSTRRRTPPIPPPRRRLRPCPPFPLLLPRSKPKLPLLRLSIFISPTARRRLPRPRRRPRCPSSSRKSSGSKTSSSHDPSASSGGRASRTSISRFLQSTGARATRCDRLLVACTVANCISFGCALFFGTGSSRGCGRLSSSSARKERRRLEGFYANCASCLRLAGGTRSRPRCGGIDTSSTEQRRRG